jgi:cyclopropane-fatty-acyl-phospholipid synthase
MSESIVPSEAQTLKDFSPSFSDRTARKIIYSLLEKLERGRIKLVEGDSIETFGRKSEAFPLEATLQVHHPRFFTNVLFGGTIGAGEAYMAGYWSTDNLTDVVRIIILNQMVFENIDKGLSRLSVPVYKLFHFMNRNTRQGSRQNILAHYDLGNEFYELFLDETLTYSCGIFESETSTLAEAAIAKYDRICRKLDLKPEDHVVEIGTGWGGFARHAVQNYGCRVTTTTISNRQFTLAQERLREAGATDRVELLQKDYRDLQGTYDKLVSIEMIEAVGHQYLDNFFQVCGRLLKDDGMMALQAITIGDHVFERHKYQVDFIKRYIFPGSCIPSITAMSRSVAKTTDLRLFHLEDITPHYATTLRLWRERFFSNIDAVRAMGYPESFIRMWDYYLSYCEAGFKERYIGDVQMIFTKPMCRQPPILPPLA